ncbi:MAG: nitroreductase family protein [Candidatus Bathyarchaeota archaeon]|nr:nitroreductase family protein [Candidatus Bathyarchaeota archaeon]
MSLLNIVLSRRSIRKYEQKKIPDEVLGKILEAGRKAPSAANRQPWRFIVVTDDTIKRELSKGLFNKHIKKSPVTIVGCADQGFVNRKWSIVDTTIALQNMVIAAWAVGVGSCWVGDFKEEKVRRLLNIPNKWKVVALVSFGYPAEKPRPTRRKTIDTIVGFNMF